MHVRSLLIVLTSATTVLAGCLSESPTAATHGIRRSGGSGPSIHTLILTASDTENTFDTWLNDISTDCSDTVVGQFDTGVRVIKLQDRAEHHITSGCMSKPNRYIEIRGRGQSSSIIVVNSTAFETSGQYGAGGTGLIIDAPNVHVHDLQIVGNAYDFPHALTTGNNGEGIKFTSTAGSGEASFLSIGFFSTAAIDVFGAAGVSVHDNNIVCPTSTDAFYGIAGSGVWMRGLEMTPSSGHNGSVNGNFIYNCSAEGITIEGASHIVVNSNQIFCQYAACLNTSIGIGLYADSNALCTTAPVSSDTVRGNIITANNGITGGIVIKVGGGHVNGGSGHGNLIDSNTVTNPGVHSPYSSGVAVSQGTCGGGGSSAFSGNKISRNTLSQAWNSQLYNGGDADSIVNNTLTVGRGDAVHPILDLSGTAIISGNVIH